MTFQKMTLGDYMEMNYKQRQDWKKRVLFGQKQIIKDKTVDSYSIFAPQIYPWAFIELDP